MYDSRVSALLAAALLFLTPVQRASPDTRYVWTDASGDEHLTREPPEQLALTNCHVTRGGAQLTIGTGKDEETGEAELEAADFDADRCVIRSRALRLQPVKGIRPFNSLEIGETVYTIGNPRRLERTLGSGLVSGKRELEGARLIQFSAPISRGSSGGGLFDAQGNLIGITSLSMRDSQGLNFAIPAEEFWK